MGNPSQRHSKKFRLHLIYFLPEFGSLSINANSAEHRATPT